MRELYDMVERILNSVNFNEIWSGFSKTDFALYNKHNVYLDKNIIPYDNRFLGNTTITYEDNNLAIWYINDVKDLDCKELSANIVHELFHSYQISQKETRFPDDIAALSYPNVLENFQLKYNENILLVNGLNSKDINEKIKLLKQLIASRKLRLKKFGELIRYEFIIETIEGSAEYCGTKALKSISRDLYEKRIEHYKKIITSDKNILFDIRKCSYYSGTLFLLLLDELEIDFSKEISNQYLTIFEQITEFIDTTNVAIPQPNSSMIKKYFKEEQFRKETLFNNFFSQKTIIHNGNFSICGYDPMNMIKLDNKILCSHFIMLKDIESQNEIFINGPAVIVVEEDSNIISTYHTVS